MVVLNAERHEEVVEFFATMRAIHAASLVVVKVQKEPIFESLVRVGYLEVVFFC